MKLKLCTLTAALITTMVTGAHAQDYQGVTFFGDSLTDSGYFGSKFTTNPDKVWSENLADKLGSTATANQPYLGKTGNNYAIGGARAGVDITHLSGSPINSLATQVNQYISTGVNPDALHVAWVGANDLFAAQALPQAEALGVISGAAKAQADSVGRLHRAGAKYILVPNLPNVGLTPQALTGGAAAQAQSTQAAALYNQLLANNLAATGANVIPLDTFSLLSEVAANPSAYAFSDMTKPACTTASSLSCSPQTLVESGANNTHFFADTIHPAGQAHRLLADYAYSVINAPTALSQASLFVDYQAINDANAQANRLNSVQLDKGVSQAWVQGGASTGEFMSADTESQRVSMGVDFTPALAGGVWGAYISGAKHTLDNTANAKFDNIGAGVYQTSQWEKLGGIKTSLMAGITKGELETSRHVAFGSYHTDHQATADVKQAYASLGISKTMAAGKALINPYLRATATRTGIDTLREDSTSATAINLANHNYYGVYGSIGAAADLPINEKWALYGDVHYQDRLNGDDDLPKARLNTIPNLGFGVPSQALDHSSFGASIGAKLSLNKGAAHLALSHTQGSDIKDTGVIAGVNVKF